MAQKARDIPADATVYDELAAIIGERLLDDGLCPTGEALLALAERDGDCETHAAIARAFGRLAIDGDARSMLDQARDLQAYMVEHLETRDPRDADRERIRLAMLVAWDDGDRTALTAAVQRLLLHDRR